MHISLTFRKLTNNLKCCLEKLLLHTYIVNCGGLNSPFIQQHQTKKASLL